MFHKDKCPIKFSIKALRLLIFPREVFTRNVDQRILPSTNIPLWWNIFIARKYQSLRGSVRCTISQYLLESGESTREITFQQYFYCSYLQLLVHDFSPYVRSFLYALESSYVDTA